MSILAAILVALISLISLIVFVVGGSLIATLWAYGDIIIIAVIAAWIVKFIFNRKK